jgi:hypothetical protein
MTIAMDRLLDMLETFVSGKDRSQAFVGDIERLLVQELRDSDVFVELTVPVASYRPEGGEHLYNSNDLAKVFEEVLREKRTSRE